MAKHQKEDKIQTVVLPGAPKIYAVTVGIGFSPTDFRLNFINEVVNTEKGKVAEIICQVALAPSVAKLLKDALTETIGKYEEVYGEIRKPEKKEEKKEESKQL